MESSAVNSSNKGHPPKMPHGSKTQLESVTIRFAGDSGDGMQVTGALFTQESAILGNDLKTRPDFPAEIRAPAGTVGGVSAFQIHFGSTEIYTAGDELDVLIAMNPAALKGNIDDLKQNGMLICNSDSFSEKNLTRAGYDHNPVDDDEFQEKYTAVLAPITSLTTEALKDIELGKSAVEKCKNFFALGIISYLYNREAGEALRWLEKKFGKGSPIAAANQAALEGGMAYAEASEIFPSSYEVPSANLKPGIYRNLTGNHGIALGLLAASEKSSIPLFYSGYPITPASDILHELSKHKAFGVRTFQAEDEIAACSAAVGASFAGALAITASSGPGIILKQEAIGLAAMVELPLVIINVQRGGPSTGLPTKTEQSDLLEVLFGRNGECPVVVLAISRPDDAFETAFEACRIALQYMVPVFLMSDGAVGTSSEPWPVPNVNDLPSIAPTCVEASVNGTPFQPYLRNEETLARNWALPGTAGLEHRIGGIEKQDLTGNISYDPKNHQHMTDLRAEKVKRVANSLPKSEVTGPESGDLLVVSWGSTYGATLGAVTKAQSEGHSVAHLHLRYLNPLPKDLGEIFAHYKKILVPEMNSGQLRLLLRAQFLLDIEGLSKVEGRPLAIQEVYEGIQNVLKKDLR